MDPAGLEAVDRGDLVDGGIERHADEPFDRGRAGHLGHACNAASRAARVG